MAEDDLDIEDPEDLNRLLIEVVMRIGPDESRFPDTSTVREMRARLVKECSEIEARGHTVDIPFIL